MEAFTSVLVSHHAVKALKLFPERRERWAGRFDKERKGYRFYGWESECDMLLAIERGYRASANRDEVTR